VIVHERHLPPTKDQRDTRRRHLTRRATTTVLPPFASLGFVLGLWWLVSHETGLAVVTLAVAFGAACGAFWTLTDTGPDAAPEETP
jgi:hypothetical protein